MIVHTTRHIILKYLNDILLINVRKGGARSAQALPGFSLKGLMLLNKDPNGLVSFRNLFIYGILYNIMPICMCIILLPKVFSFQNFTCVLMFYKYES